MNALIETTWIEANPGQLDFWRRNKRVKAEARKMMFAIKLYRRQGYCVYAFNASFADACPQDAAEVIANFHRHIKGEEDHHWRWYLEQNGRKSPGHWRDEAHLHGFIVTPISLSQDAASKWWHDALKQAGVTGRASFYIQPVRTGWGMNRKGEATKYSAKTVAKYQCGDTWKKRQRPPFRSGLGVGLCGGTQNFFQRPAVQLYQFLCTHDAAVSMGLNDPHVLDHPSIDHYFSLASAAWAEAKEEKRMANEARWMGDPTIPVEFELPKYSHEQFVRHVRTLMENRTGEVLIRAIEIDAQAESDDPEWVPTEIPRLSKPLSSNLLGDEFDDAGTS